MMVREFVVEFRMPEDDLLSFRRTNVPAGDKAGAVTCAKTREPHPRKDYWYSCINEKKGAKK